MQYSDLNYKITKDNFNFRVDQHFFNEFRLKQHFIPFKSSEIVPESKQRNKNGIMPFLFLLSMGY